MIEKNDPLKERWRAKGFLLPMSEAYKEREFEFAMCGRVFIGELCTSSSGGWDDYTRKGNVHTPFLSIRKCRMLTEEDVVMEFSQIIFLRWAFSLAIMKEKRE